MKPSTLSGVIWYTAEMWPKPFNLLVWCRVVSYLDMCTLVFECNMYSHWLLDDG
jgi:hypothetical protein